MTAMFRSLGSLNYRLWFAGALVSNIGAWMQRTAQDWIVLTELTDHDAAAVGITMALQFGPAVVLSPFAGVLVDRVSGRTLLAFTQTAMGVLALGLGVLVLTGHAQLWMVYAFATGLGVVTAMDAPARQTFVGELVPPSDLPNAVALNSASFNSARLIGPAVAGVMTAAIGAGWVFLINGFSFISVLLALWALRRDRLHPMDKDRRGRGQLRAGFRYLRDRPDIMAVLLMVFIVGAFAFNFPIYTSTMARVEFGQGAGEFGVLTSVLAIGSIAGALSAARRSRPRMRTMVGAAVGLGLAIGIAGLMPTIETFAVALVPIGFFALTLMTTANAYVQTTTVSNMRGRVMAIYIMVFTGGTPIGAPVVGTVVNAFGPRWAFAVGAFGCAMAALVLVAWLMAGRGLRVRRVPGSRWRLAVHQPDSARTADPAAGLSAAEQQGSPVRPADEESCEGRR